MFLIQSESVKSREEAYCDGEPTESIHALLLKLAIWPVRCNGRKKTLYALGKYIPSYIANYKIL